ncbi:MAG: hypothetical protein IJN77_07460 [Oscillospiraceae bacterium]|nr:hypothetical protein [Oscillospiraceae bacterium]
MKVLFDTDEIRAEIILTEEENEDAEKAVQSLIFGLATIAFSFMKENILSKNYEETKSFVVDMFSEILNMMIEKDREHTLARAGSADRELEDMVAELRRMMTGGPFSEEEIDNFLDLIIRTGSVEEAIRFLMGLEDEEE